MELTLKAHLTKGPRTNILVHIHDLTFLPI